MPPGRPERGRPAAVFARLDADDLPPLEDIENGADGLVLVFAGAPTARGFGLDVASLDAALAGVELDLLPLRLEPAPFGGLDAVRALLEVADARRVPASSLDLDAGIDPIGSLARTGGAPQPWPALATLTAEAAELLRERGLAGTAAALPTAAPVTTPAPPRRRSLPRWSRTGLAYLRALDGAGVPLGEARNGPCRSCSPPTPTSS